MTLLSVTLKSSLLAWAHTSTLHFFALFFVSCTSYTIFIINIFVPVCKLLTGLLITEIDNNFRSVMYRKVGVSLKDDIIFRGVATRWRVYRYIYPPKIRPIKLFMEWRWRQNGCCTYSQAVLKFYTSQNVLYLPKTNFWLRPWSCSPWLTFH